MEELLWYGVLFTKDEEEEIAITHPLRFFFEYDYDEDFDEHFDLYEHFSIPSDISNNRAAGLLEAAIGSS